MEQKPEKIVQLPLSQRIVQPQIREFFDPQRIHDLMLSLKEVGQLLPIRVCMAGDKFTVVDGAIRCMAAEQAGWKTIAGIVEESNLSDDVALQKQIIANIQRVDLAPLEKAKAVRRLMDVCNLNNSQAAAKLGVSGSTITRSLKLLALPPDVQTRVANGEIAPSAAYELACMDDPNQRAALAEQLVGGGVTRDAVAGARKAARRPRSKEAAPTSRATAVLGPGRSVTAAGPDLDLESFIELLETLLAKARRARTQGVELTTFTKMLRDQNATV